MLIIKYKKHRISFIFYVVCCFKKIIKMVMFYLLIGAICFDIIFAGFPQSRPRCKAGDVKCLQSVINIYIGESADGIPDINLPPLDPYVTDELNIERGRGTPFDIAFNIQNLENTGLSTTQVSRVIGFDKDPKTSKFHIQGRVPKLTITFDYQVNAKVMFFPVNGDGTATIDFENVDLSIKADPKVDIKNSKEYLQFKKVNVDFNTTRVTANFENLFNGNEFLGRGANQFLNDNWPQILSVIKADLLINIGNLMKDAINPVISTFPYEDFFLQG